MSGRKLLIVEARFYASIADDLAVGAVSAIEAAGASHERIAVPGAFEIPGAIAMAAETERYDGYVALGCVIRGETTHYDYICAETARALMDLSLSGIPLGNGILTVETKEQADVRADPSRKDKGGDAARAALRMIELAEAFAND